MTQTSAHPPFVLVHGGRHGGWCWARVATLLREAGHDVYTPTLTGLGERAHLLRPDIGLETHIQDLVAVFEFEEITDVVLVGHSYGGCVVAGAMEQIADRVRSLVFIEALVPQSGESMFDIVDPEIKRGLRRLAERDGEGWYLPASDASFYGISEPADVAWVNGKLTAQPLKTYTDPIGVAEHVWAHPGMFIECSPSQLTPDMLQRMRARAKVQPRFTYRIIECAHDMMVTEPELLTALLLDEVAASSRHPVEA
jgi:pimeloyl-ACP methyl ester carboxylesterase